MVDNVEMWEKNPLRCLNSTTQTEHVRIESSAVVFRPPSLLYCFMHSELLFSPTWLQRVVIFHRTAFI